ncbi:CHAD domain-containing protein [Kibdelosporangium phytohabitans]|uniref:CHAD domain-containing protein n=1 Tax=Kibdelosporangium phytohabitans TaxID=860235 RepID=UPI000A4D00B6|nr:CHAD domain-containing protein [Kibdelosporangium phytohabitans]MBE1467859.1 CHAD domain-containing protein [Kibdelosporangium phytohabitans]
MTTSLTPSDLGLPSEPITARRKDPPAIHVRVRLDSQLRALLAHEAGTKSGVDPEDLHQMRVTIRRLRAAVNADGAGLGEIAPPLQEDLKWLGNALGPVRDLDVQLDRLRAEAAGFDDDERAAVERLLGGLITERKAARRRMLAAMRTKRYNSLLTSLAAATVSEPEETTSDNGGRDAVISVIYRPYRKLFKAVAALGEDPVDEQLHALRIKGKRLRYAAELVGAAGKEPVKELIKATKAFQEVLGEHQDAAVAEDIIRRLSAGQQDPAVIFVAGRLVEREHARRLAYRSQWRDKWDAVAAFAADFNRKTT